MTASTASAELVLMLVGPQGLTVPVQATLAFDQDDPFAVTAEFHVGDMQPVRWTFARDLLADGLSRPAGEGDVTVWPELSAEAPSAVVLHLNAPEGAAVLRADRDAVAQFLAATFALVPRGTEAAHLDLDLAIAALLAA